MTGTPLPVLSRILPAALLAGVAALGCNEATGTQPFDVFPTAD